MRMKCAPHPSPAAARQPDSDDDEAASGHHREERASLKEVLRENQELRVDYDDLEKKYEEMNRFYMQKSQELADDADQQMAHVREAAKNEIADLEEKIAHLQEELKASRFVLDHESRW